MSKRLQLLINVRNHLFNSVKNTLATDEQYRQLVRLNERIKKAKRTPQNYFKE